MRDGILTREGWYVLDDSRTAVLIPKAPGFAVRPTRAGAYQNWYAFAYGQDLTRVPAETIRDARVVLTVVGGRVVFERAPAR